MRALINAYDHTVLSLHATRACLESALGRFHLQAQFVVQSGESIPIKPMAVELNTVRHVGEYCTEKDFTVLLSPQPRSKPNAQISVSSQRPRFSTDQSNPRPFPF